MSSRARSRPGCEELISLLMFLVPAAARGDETVHALPAAAAPGETTEVSFLGDGLAGATGLWTSFPAAVDAAESPGEPGMARFRLRVPAEVEVGIYGVRVVTSKSLSAMVLFMVDDLPGVQKFGGNHDAATAEHLTLPVAVDGACDEGRVDVYRVSGRAGEWISIEVVAWRLGSILDPVLRLLDVEGRELARCDDAPGVESDSRIRHRLPADGEYLIEIRDVGRGGGSRHRYRLRVGNFPLATTPFPLTARAGTAGTFEFAGTAVGGVPPRRVELPPETEGEVCLGLRFPGGNGSGFVTLRAGDLEEHVEVEPNDTIDTAGEMVVPGAVNGRFLGAGDRDHFRFRVEEGQRLVFSGRDRSLGSPTHLYLAIRGRDGRTIARAKISGAAEAAIDHTFAAPGTHVLMVEELNRFGGPEQAYRVEVRRWRPGFTLGVEREAFFLSPGGSLEIDVSCARRDFKGPVNLGVEIADGDGRVSTEDFVLERNTIPAGKKETRLRVRLPDRFTPGTVLALRITGHARAGDLELRARASTRPALKRLFPETPFPPAALDGLIGVAIGPTPE